MASPRGMAGKAVVVATAGVFGGLILAADDLARIHATHSEYLARGADRWVHVVAVLGALCLLGLLLGLAIGGWLAISARLGRRSKYLRAVLGSLPLVAVVAVLNTNVWTVAPLVYLAFVLVFSALATLAVWFGSGRFAWLGAAVAVAAALHMNATLYVGLYPGQHLTLALVAAVGAIGLAKTAIVRWPVLASPAVVAIAAGTTVLMSGLLFSMGASEVSQNARYLSFEAAPMQRHAVALLSKLTDWDRDGLAALLGSGDCENFDRNVHPRAVEVLNNGIDDDCLGGDLTDVAVQNYMDAMARNAPAPTAGPAAAKHLVFITVDALRRDRMPRMPNLDRLATEGIRFDRMYVTYPSTVLSLYGASSSLFASQIQLSRYKQFEFPIHDPHTTLAEVLGDSGFSVHGWMFHHMFATEYGITRGFDTAWVTGSSRDEVHAVAGGPTVDRAIAALDELTAGHDRLFLWVHLYDPHDPYQRHPKHDDSEAALTGYDSEVLYTDEQLGRLIAALRAKGIAQEAIIAIFADHGEEFGDHGGRFHGTHLYDESVRVPAVVLIPGAASHVVDRPVSVLDLAPTALDYLGLGAHTPASFRGQSLRALLEGKPVPERPVFTECFRRDGSVLRAVVQGPWKLVHWRDQRFFELYNLDHDPNERFNMYDLTPGIASSLESLLGAWVGVEL